MLWMVFQLKFTVHDQIGPAAYPFVFLVILLIISVILLVQALTSDYMQIFSPFLQGLNEDQLIRKVADVLSKRLGRPIRVKTYTGIGRFSAMWKGINASADGKTLMIVSSDTNEIPNLYASDYVLEKTEPLARLFFSPDGLIVGKDSEFKDYESFFSRLQSGKDRIRIGITHHPAVDYSVENWLNADVGHSFEAIPSEDYIDLKQKLFEGKVDALICNMGDAADDVSEDNAMKLLAVFSDVPIRGFAEVPTVSWKGASLVSGKWAGLALPKGVSKQRYDELHTGLSDIFENPQSLSVLAKEGVCLDYLNRQDFMQFLNVQKETLESINHGAVENDIESGKIVGLVLAVTLTFLFAFVMHWIGFPLTAVFFLLVLITSLWSKINKKAMAIIAGISVGVSMAIYFVFWQIFYVVFPDPTLFGG